MNITKRKKSMWPFIIGAAAIGLIAKAFSDDSDEKIEEAPKKVFISFAMEDEISRDHLVGQAKMKKTPFEFIDMSVKEPWDDEEWQRRCRTKIKRCDGVIVLLSNYTWHSSGVRWEIKCAKEENVPVIGMHIRKNYKGAIPPELKGKKIIEWTWDNLADAIERF